MRDEPTSGPRPQVYARLAADAELRNTLHRPPRGTRIAGWLIVVAVAATVAYAVLGAGPW